MRIAIDASRTVVAQRTGTERYSLELTRALLELDRANHYSLYFNQPPTADLIPPGPSWDARIIPMRRLWTHLQLSRALVRDRPDLLFVPAHVLPLVHPSRSVVTVHDVGFRFFPRAHPRLARWYLELSTRWAARRATRLIAVSQATARDFGSLYGVPADRISVVYEGVDPHFRPAADPAALAELRQRYDLGETPYLLGLGTIQPRKNLQGLLQAFRLFLDEAQAPLLLVLAGRPGWDADVVETQIQRLGLGSRVRRAGYVPDKDLGALYSGALAYVQPSLYEGFGLTALEAMACGTPVIASNSSALPEIVGEAGLLVDPGSPREMAAAIERIVTQPALREQLREAGPRRAAQFTWDRCARETLEVLLEAARA